MTTNELLLSINGKAAENINTLSTCESYGDFSKCIAFTEDIELWISLCGSFSNNPLVKEARSQCLSSIVLCAQGFYKPAIFALRQFFEHMLFAIKLSTDDYKFRLWQAGQFDMSWAQLMDENEGIFARQFIRMYAKDLDDSRSTGLRTTAKNVYRECSEFVHGNYEKLDSLPEVIQFDLKSLNCYLDYFLSVQYIIFMALFIRYRDILEKKENLVKLEPIIAEQLGTLPEVQLIFNEDEGERHE